MPIAAGHKLLVTKGCLLGGLRLPARDQLSLRGFGWPLARISELHSACTLCTIDRYFYTWISEMEGGDLWIAFIYSLASMGCGCDNMNCHFRLFFNDTFLDPFLWNNCQWNASGSVDDTSNSVPIIARCCQVTTRKLNQSLLSSNTTHGGARSK